MLGTDSGPWWHCSNCGEPVDHEGDELCSDCEEDYA